VPTAAVIQALESDTLLDITGGCDLFIYEQSVRSMGVFRLRGTAEFPAFWEGVINQGDKSQLKIRWGIATEEGLREGCSWHPVFLTRALLHYQGANVVRIDIEGADSAYKLLEKETDKAYSNSLISEIVAEIAHRNKLQAVLSPTEGRGDYWQRCESDIEFIRKRLLPLAVGTDGRKDFMFYIDGDILHFHPPDLKQQPAKLDASPRPSGAFRDWPAIMTLVYDRGKALPLGILPMKGRGFDMLRKECVVCSTIEPAVDWSLSRPAIQQAPLLGRPIPFPRQQQLRRDEVQNYIDVLWGQNRRQLVTARLIIPGHLKVKVGDIADVICYDAEGKPKLGAGKYLIAGATHKIRSGHYQIILTLERWGI